MTESTASKRMRAAVVLFVDSESGGSPIDLGAMVQGALHQNGIMDNGLAVTLAGKEHHLRVIDVMEAGAAAGNGYLWTEVTPRAWNQRGL